MDLNDLQLFCHIVKRGSFAGAAADLKLSNGTISRRMQILERRLGTPLLIRSTRKMELTEFGQGLYRRCDPLVDELETVQQELVSRQSRPSGLISVLLPTEFFAPQFSRLLLDFAAAYPDIKIECSHYAEAFPTYVTGKDLGFAWYEDAMPDSDWIASELMSLPQACYAAPGFAGIEEMAELANQECLTQPGEKSWYFRTGGKDLSVKVGGRLQLNSPNMRLQAALAGAGICKIPCYLGDPYVEQGLLQKLALNAEPAALVVAMLYHSKNLPFRTRAFIDYFQSHIAQQE